MKLTGLDKQHVMLMLALDKTLFESARAAGCVLVDHYNVETGLCFPSIKLMAAETQRDESTIKRAIKRLEKTEWIDWTKKGRNYHYTINWEKVRVYSRPDRDVSSYTETTAAAKKQGATLLPIKKKQMAVPPPIQRVLRGK